MITIAHERRRTATDPGFSDAVTYSFADPDRGWYGLMRIGLAGAKASELAVLFRDREPVAALAEGDKAVPEDADWDRLEVEALATEELEPLQRWRIAWRAAEHAVELTFSAVSAPAQTGAEVASAGGMEGYEQLCAFQGTIDGQPVKGFGQRGHTWGAPDWSRLELTRTLSGWLDADTGGFTATSIRPAGAASHADEALWVALVHEGDPHDVADPRLSTTYDGDGRQRRVGLELWVSEEDGYPYRAAGEIVCGSTLDLGHLRMDLAFIRWHAEGQTGIGRYDIVRRAA